MSESQPTELDLWRRAWLKVCSEGCVPQYENIKTPRPEGILHGIRQLAAMWAGEKCVREKKEERLRKLCKQAAVVIRQMGKPGFSDFIDELENAGLDRREEARK